MKILGIRRHGARGAGALVSLAAIVAASAPAIAQTQSGGGVDVIIVTPQQRDENIQDVPISVAAIPEDKLTAMFAAGEDVVALASRVPGLYAESSNGRAAPRFYIRGLGNTDFDLAASQPVSVIMDEIVMENVALKSTPIFDVEQVEVARGPQGTLFGRNTTAGIIKFTSKRPTQEFVAEGGVSYGNYGNLSMDGAVGGALIEDVLSARVSFLVQHRDDWIDNAADPVDDKDLGEFNERAGRLQLLFTPNDKFEGLFNLHSRDLEGTSAIFRANVIDQGTNGLNASYDRDVVSFDGGGDNLQEYNGWGASANLSYDFGGATLTSITGYETADGSSRGDIDGSAGPYTFNFTGPYTYPELPFDSDTQDSIDGLEQFTQELRLADGGDDAFFWQVGAYWFDSSFDVTTVGPTGFPPSTTLTHENKSWAVYGQGSYDITDAFTATAGVRYTNDEKSLFVPANPGQNRQVEDDYVSWELSGIYDVTPDFSLFARVADGFRGPSIQGRDVAFFADPSVAQSETILSWEAGWKSQLAGNTLRLNGAVFAYTVEDIQLTAVGGTGNSVQLINAAEGKAVGGEIDAEWAPTDNFVMTGGVSFADTELNDPNLAVGVCAQCTVTDPLNANGFALIDGNPFPNAPEVIADFTARWSHPMGDKGEIFAFTDWAYQGETNFLLYDSVEFNIDSQFEGGLRLGYARTDGSYEAAFFVRNITDEDNIKGVIDFNNNTAFVNEPRLYGLSLRMKY